MARKGNNSKSRKFEKNNDQDAAMEREFKKGERAGEMKSKKFPQSRANTSACNDPSWYAKNAQLLESAASFSYGTPLGSPFRYDLIRPRTVDSNIEQLYAAGTVAVPGLWTLTVAPTPGVSRDAQSPVNTAAQNVYSYVRYKNSGASNYDAPDLMLYLLAMDSLYAAWNWAKRLYGCVSSYSIRNRYMPEAYILGNMVDFADLIEHLADFRAFLNKTGAQINSFCVPATMNYNVRHSWMFSNIYKDSDTQKAQQYMFVPAWFYKYSETTSDTGGQLIPQQVTTVEGQLLKTADIYNLINGMLNALAYSEDIGIMSGDINKAYGENLFRLSPVEPEYSVMPVFNQEVLMQIENCHTVLYSQATIGSWTIGQNPNTNFLTFNPLVGANRHQATMLNMHMENPTPADSMVASRLITLVGEQGDNFTVHPTSLGSEIVTAMHIIHFMPKSAVDTPTAGMTGYNYEYSLVATEVNNLVSVVTSTSPAQPTTPVYTPEQAMYILDLIESFDWHPTIHMVLYEYTDANTRKSENWLEPFCDIDTYTIISVHDVDRLHEVALLSLFDVPADGPTF